MSLSFFYIMRIQILHHFVLAFLYYAQATHPDVNECTLWIAPSTIPGAGLGLFAGKDFAEQDTVTPGDLTVPLLDMHWHNNAVESFDDNQFLWDEYTWADHSFRRMEQEGVEVFGASFGIGALPNCLFPLINVDETVNKFDTAQLHRQLDPGAGAFTPYHDRVGYAVEDIPAGHEIFVDYGMDYFLQDTRIASMGLVPFEESYRAADRLVYAFVDLMQQYNQLVIEDLYNFVRTNVSHTWRSRTLLALPPLHNKNNTTFHTALLQLARHGTGSIHQDRSIRSLAWLREHGTCTSHLEIRRSTIKQAGRGAFSTIAIPAGHVVAAVPLLHIPDRSILNMRDDLSSNDVVHQQLLLNYCFGHPQSTLLLCPYGVASSAINHHHHHGAGPNVRIEWSRKLTLHPEWWDMPLEEWAYRYTAGLVFEYIATRDIAKGEEIFLDYGPLWAAAWEQHVAQWTPKGPYVTEAELNSDWEGILPTVAEHEYRHVELLCREDYRRMRGLEPSDTQHHRCRIRLRTDELRYVAEVIAWIDKRSTETCFVRVKEVLLDLPRDAFVFRDLPYTRDHAQYWSFRQELQIPEELFPTVWKNRL